MPPRRKSTETTTPDISADIDTSVPEISKKNSKQELLDAYEQVVQRLSKRETDVPLAKVEAERRRQESVGSSARGVTVSGVVTAIGTLKLDIGTVLNNVSQKLIEQVDTFKQIEEATSSESKRLAELHDIEIAADTLALLIQRHQDAEAEFSQRADDKRDAVHEQLLQLKEDVESQLEKQRSEFDAEMQQKRAAWQQEQAEHETAQQERVSRLKREQAREQEEYDYTLGLKRARDADADAAKSAGQDKQLAERRSHVERDLAAREENLAAREAESAQLRERVQSFTAELEHATAVARKAGYDAATREAETAKALSDREIAGERQVSQLRIESLQTKVVDQAQRLEDLTKQLGDATGKVQEIAVKAIEGAAGRRALQQVNEIALEQAKQKRQS